MAYLATEASGSQVSIPIDETVKKLRKAMPEGHDVVRRVERCFESCREVIEDHAEAAEERAQGPDIGAALDHLVAMVSDWKAGIRDWEEVEPALDEARRAVDWT